MRETIVIHRGKKPFIDCSGTESKICFSNPITISTKKPAHIKVNVGKIYHSDSMFIVEENTIKGVNSEKELQKKELNFLLSDFGMSLRKRKFLLWLFNVL